MVVRGFSEGRWYCKNSRISSCSFFWAWERRSFRRRSLGDGDCQQRVSARQCFPSARDKLKRFHDSVHRRKISSCRRPTRRIHSGSARNRNSSLQYFRVTPLVNVQWWIWRGINEDFSRRARTCYENDCGKIRGFDAVSKAVCVHRETNGLIVWLIYSCWRYVATNFSYDSCVFLTVTQLNSRLLSFILDT